MLVVCFICRYVSCVVGCPYEGFIAPKAVAMVRFKIVKKHVVIFT